jgi:excisionase family DNA binding protein
MANDRGGDSPGEREVLNTAEAAAFLGVDPKLLAKWAKAGKVPSQKPGKGYLYSRAALLTWLAGPSAPAQTVRQARPKELVG